MTDLRFRVLAGVATLAIVLVILHFQFARDPAPPPAPKKPVIDNHVDLNATDYSPLLFKSDVEHDCEDFQIPKVTLDELGAVFPGRSALPKKLLAVGASLDTDELHLSLRTESLTAAMSAGKIETPHLVLSIQNKTDHPLAYRVDTSLNASPQICVAKADYKQNAIALLPHETQQRTECIAGDQAAITVDRIESIDIPMISYYYVSKVNPADIGENRLTTRGHAAPVGTLCEVPDSVNRALQHQQATWRDVIDFYSRHNCAKYSYFQGYKAFSRPGERTLPARL
jgi:hypothetical protein